MEGAGPSSPSPAPPAPVLPKGWRGGALNASGAKTDAAQIGCRVRKFQSGQPLLSFGTMSYCAFAVPKPFVLSIYEVQDILNPTLNPNPRTSNLKP